MSLQAKYASVVARELRHHAVWQPGDPVRLGDYGLLDGGRFSVQGNIADDFEIVFETTRSRKQEFAFRSDGVSESKGEANAKQPGAVAELRVGFKRANSLYVSSPTAFTEQMKGISKILSPLRDRPEWRPEWLVVTRVYHAGPAIILLSNSDGADVKIHLGADGGAVSGDSNNDVGEEGSVALQLTGVHGPLFLGLHRVDKTIEDVAPKQRLLNRVLVLASLGFISAGAVTAGVLVKAQKAAGEAVAMRYPEAPRPGDGVAEDAPLVGSKAGESRPESKADVMPEKANPAALATTGALTDLGQVGHGGGSEAIKYPPSGETGVAAEADDPAAATATSGKAVMSAKTPTPPPVTPRTSPTTEAPSPGSFALAAAAFAAGVSLLVLWWRRRGPRIHPVDASAPQ